MEKLLFYKNIQYKKKESEKIEQNIFNYKKSRDNLFILIIVKKGNINENIIIRYLFILYMLFHNYQNYHRVH